MALNGDRVVLLEDDGQMAGLLKDFLGEEGYEVTRCFSIEEVRAALAAQPGALALCDDWSNEFSELSAGHRAEIVSLAGSCALVLMTGRVWAAALGADELGGAVVLRKPLTLSGVLRALEAAKWGRSGGEQALE